MFYAADFKEMIMRFFEKYMLIIVTGLIVLSGTLFAEDETRPADEDGTGSLISDILQEKSFRTGLSTRGTTGLILTAAPECLASGGQFLGFRVFSNRLKYNSETTTDIGAAVSWAYGFSKDLPLKILKHVEFSATLPVLMRDGPDDSKTGLGDGLFSVKAQILEEDSLRPTVPAVGLLASIIVPTGSSEFEQTEGPGLEAGVMFGKTLTNTADLARFKVYGELRGRVIEKDDTADFMFKADAGMAFPFGMYEDWFILAEYEYTARSDISGENGYVLLVGMQYMEQTFNATIGFITQYLDDIDTYERKIVLMYDVKF